MSDGKKDGRRTKTFCDSIRSASPDWQNDGASGDRKSKRNTKSADAISSSNA